MAHSTPCERVRHRWRTARRVRPQPWAGSRGAPAGGSNLTKVDFRGRQGQILEVPTNTTGRLWTLRFHDLAIAMNTNLRSTIDGTRTWLLPPDLHGKPATEMTTGRKISALPPTMQLAPLDAVVLRFDA